MIFLSDRFIFSHKLYVFVFFLIFSTYSCKYSQPIFSKSQKLERKIFNSDIFKNQFTGFVLFDAKKNKEVLNINGNKFFTPASNTKIFTFYTSMMVLNDSIPLLKYFISNDSLIFWGTGNPLCLNPDFADNSYSIDFLSNRKEKLYFCDDNFQDDKLGSGWAWDDYLYDYQLEKNSFPIYGNRLKIDFKNGSTIVSPSFFNEKIVFNTDSNYYYRNIYENNFTIGKFKNDKTVSIPLVIDSMTVLLALKNATKKHVNECPELNKSNMNFSQLNIPTPDSIYIRLLHNSDNFIAEQLILMCSHKLFDTLNTKKTINWSKENLLPNLQHNCRWVDGSGLSRYNLFSPKDMVYVLSKIYNKLTWEQIKYFFPTAGKSGTLKNTYKSISEPYIFAKSGSLSNNYNLSGFIITKKKNKYIFSFMNNHFLKKSSSIKHEMEKIFMYIYENY